MIALISFGRMKLIGALAVFYDTILALHIDSPGRMLAHWCIGGGQRSVPSLLPSPSRSLLCQPSKCEAYAARICREKPFENILDNETTIARLRSCLMSCRTCTSDKKTGRVRICQTCRHGCGSIVTAFVQRITCCDPYVMHSTLFPDVVNPCSGKPLYVPTSTNGRSRSVEEHAPHVSALDKKIQPDLRKASTRLALRPRDYLRANAIPDPYPICLQTTTLHRGCSRTSNRSAR
jgi:hypothetical protein